MDARELLDAIKRIRHFVNFCRDAHAARSFAYLADEAIRQAESDPPGIPVLGRVDGTGRVTFFKD